MQQPIRPENQPVSAPVSDTFEMWAKRWLDLADFRGSYLPEPDRRIQRALQLWDSPIPGSWQRGDDNHLLGPRYRRGDANSPHPGEHTIENEILKNLDVISCLGGRLLDGINAMPLVRDETGRRRANVEGDLFLLLERAGKHHLVICEIKDNSNTSWYAAIENFRQVKLAQLSSAARRLFHRRLPHLSLPREIPVIGLVVAPAQYYIQAGQKANVLPHTMRLMSEFTAKTGIEAHLAIWDAGSKAITVRPSEC